MFLLCTVWKGYAVGSSLNFKILVYVILWGHKSHLDGVIGM